MTTAQNALKDVYLEVVSNQLNTKTNVLLNQFRMTTNDVYGREVQKLVPYGINGGVGAGDEGGVLPSAGGNNYLNFTSTLKNLFGSIEISDKAIRASADDAGAFVNLLTAEMEGLLMASKFNLGRMLYGNGTGQLATVSSAVAGTGLITVSSVNNLVEGMVVDFHSASGALSGYTGARIASIDRANKKIKLDRAVTSDFVSAASGLSIFVQGSKGQELTGLGAVLGSEDIYGTSRTAHPWLISYSKAKTAQETLSEDFIQAAIDEVEARTGNRLNFIVTTGAVKRVFASALAGNRFNLDPAVLAGGYQTLSFNGIPLFSDKFMPAGSMYILNTEDFALHQLCDWEWLTNEDGSILKQKNGYASYLATLVKYAELVCSKPGGQGKLTNLS